MGEEKKLRKNTKSRTKGKESVPRLQRVIRKWKRKIRSRKITKEKKEK